VYLINLTDDIASPMDSALYIASSKELKSVCSIDGQSSILRFHPLPFVR
jgi:hypothetical protein